MIKNAIIRSILTNQELVISLAEDEPCLALSPHCDRFVSCELSAGMIRNAPAMVHLVEECNSEIERRRYESYERKQPQMRRVGGKRHFLLFTWALHLH